MEKIIVTGGCGQIGSELVALLRQKYGNENVVLTDVQVPNFHVQEIGPWEILDVTSYESLKAVFTKFKPTKIFHMAAILSATGEKIPQTAFNVNLLGTRNILELAREFELPQVIVPSTIAVFGPETPKQNTPNETVMRPNTMYGITKVSIELLGEYYAQVYGIDFRTLRYPGIISSDVKPGGGTTDYANGFYFDAATRTKSTCFVSPETILPFMFMPDALRSIVELSEAPQKNLKHRSFNLAAFSCSALEIAESVKKYLPSFEFEFVPDHRDKIAASWPQSIDDSCARNEWNWKHEFDLDGMTEGMLKNLKVL
ncbi:MAG: NAD-dependent epimerase/dehydratase family protein [Calditrichaeota bacterium]|nr:MAG: NAD-dependent epimerase/dehydratase family protein [Calditrichota bacterium]